MEKMAWHGPKWGPRGIFPANSDLADVLGRTDLDFENFYFFDFLDPKFLDFQVPRFPKSGPWPGLGRTRPLKPSGPKHLDVSIVNIDV